MLTGFQNSFISSKFAVTWWLYVSAPLKHDATLPCDKSAFKSHYASELSEANCHARLSHLIQYWKIFQ